MRSARPGSAVAGWVFRPTGSSKRGLGCRCRSSACSTLRLRIAAICSEPMPDACAAFSRRASVWSMSRRAACQHHQSRGQVRWRGWAGGAALGSITGRDDRIDGGKVRQRPCLDSHRNALTPTAHRGVRWARAARTVFGGGAGSHGCVAAGSDPPDVVICSTVISASISKPADWRVRSRR